MTADLQSDDYYENLGVARDASEQEIKTACVLRSLCGSLGAGRN